MDNFLEQIENGSRESNLLIFGSVVVSIVFYSIYPNSSYITIILLVLSNTVLFISKSNTLKVEKITENITEKLDYLDLVLSETTFHTQVVSQLRNENIIEGTETSSSVNLKSYFYLEPDLILFLYSIRDFEKYSKFTYSRLLKNINILLKLKNDFSLKTPEGEISLQNTASQLKVAKRFYTLSINYYHSFIYKIPRDSNTKQKFQEGLNRLRILLKRVLKDMRKITQEQLSKKGIDVNTEFIGFEFDGIKEFDESVIDNQFYFIYG